MLFNALFLASAAFGQDVVPPDRQPVSGNCVVGLNSGSYWKETCTVSTENGTVPNGFRLTIEHVSATCGTHSSRGIVTLALITKLSPQDRGKFTHIPVSTQASLHEQVRVTGAHMIRAYAASGTNVEVLLSTWEFAPPGFTSCEVTFSGQLERINQ
jgi:hypothetical protein